MAAASSSIRTERPTINGSGLFTRTTHRREQSGRTFRSRSSDASGNRRMWLRGRLLHEDAAPSSGASGPRRDGPRPERAAHFSTYHKVHEYPSLEAVLQDSQVDTVLNLTNPHSHYEVTRACLEAGKHVYTEKPLAMDFEQARELFDLARERGLHLTGAPCSVLNPGRADAVEGDPRTADRDDPPGLRRIRRRHDHPHALQEMAQRVRDPLAVQG